MRKRGREEEENVASWVQDISQKSTKTETSEKNKHMFKMPGILNFIGLI
jgi:hypothetical protein